MVMQRVLATVILGLALGFSGCGDDGTTPSLDSGVDSGVDGGADSGVDGGTDSGVDGGVDGGTDSGIDSGADGGTDGGMDGGTDGGTDGGIDGGIDGGTDGGTEGGTDGGTEGGTDGGTDGGTGTGALPWDPAVGPIVLGSGAIGFGDVMFLPDGDILTVGSGRTIQRVARSDGSATTLATGIGTSYLLGVTYRESTGLIYVSDSPGQIFEVTGAGVATLVTSIGNRVHSLSIVPAGFGAFGGLILATVRDGRVLAINPVGGSVTTIGTVAGGDISDHIFASDGTLYLADNGGEAVHTMTSAGVVATVATGFSGLDGITLDEAGGRLFVTNSGDGTVDQVTIPGGVVTQLTTTTLNGGDNVTGCVYDQVSTFIYRHSSGRLEMLTY